MTLKIEPYTYSSNDNNIANKITYWGIYLDDLEISTTSTKEQALETKEWMENYLDAQH